MERKNYLNSISALGISLILLIDHAPALALEDTLNTLTTAQAGEMIVVADSTESNEASPSQAATAALPAPDVKAATIKFLLGSLVGLHATRGRLTH